MIVKTTDIQEINKIIRNVLILQSGLQPNQVMNGVSLHGTELLERINQYAYKTYTLDSSFIVFVLESRESESDFSQTQEDGKLRMVASYQMHCYVYGYESQKLANMIIARIRSEYSRLNLQQSGIYLESVSSATTGNDFINNTLMIRTDFFINMSVEMEIEQVSDGEEFEYFDLKVGEMKIWQS